MDPRAQTEAERPVGKGTYPDQGQRVCTLDGDEGGDWCEKQSTSQRASRTGRCLWNGRERRRDRSRGWSP